MQIIAHFQLSRHCPMSKPIYIFWFSHIKFLVFIRSVLCLTRHINCSLSPGFQMQNIPYITYYIWWKLFLTNQAKWAHIQQNEQAKTNTIHIIQSILAPEYAIIIERTINVFFIYFNLFKIDFCYSLLSFFV